MNYQDFVGHVQNRARLASEDQAVAAIRATLETLAERISFDESTDLASQLPEEIADFLVRDSETDRETFSLTEFFQRVSQREGVPAADAESHARAVFAMLGVCITRGDLDELRSELPANYRALFEGSASAPMRPH